MNFQEQEVAKIKERYAKRKRNIYDAPKFFYANLYTTKEREIVYARFIKEYLGKDISSKKIIEIGAGVGYNLLYFISRGFSWQHVYANELLEERYCLLQKSLPAANCILDDALNLNYKEEFDVVFQSTVFTSILDKDFRKALADKMFDMLKPGGIILSYDFTYNNPNNKDVQKLTKKEIKELFPHCTEIQFKKVTLAPPVARKVGKLYDLINFLFPILRTHLIAVIKK
jgi:SAM-dependent methyltransferase